MPAPTGNQNARKLPGTGATRVARIPAEWDVATIAEQLERMQTLLEEWDERAARSIAKSSKPEIVDLESLGIHNSSWREAVRLLNDLRQCWSPSYEHP